jgi:hypothetical protein
MVKKQPFVLIYDPEVRGHLDAIETKYHSLIRRTLEEQLRFEPETATRNRKQLERPIDLGARWNSAWDRTTAFASFIAWMSRGGRFAFWRLP